MNNSAYHPPPENSLAASRLPQTKVFVLEPNPYVFGDQIILLGKEKRMMDLWM